MAALRERLAGGGVLLGDGGMGTSLPVSICPELLNVSRPDVVRDVTRAFFDAGAGILQTNTFGGSPLKLAAAGLAGRAEELNRAAAEIALDVAGGRAFVTGSCGPCGRVLEPFGDLSAAEFRESFIRQARALAAAGVDALSIETLLDVEEGVLALSAAREASPELVLMASVTFRATARGLFTHFGTPLAEAGRRLVAAGAEVVGVNCGAGLAEMLPAVRELHDAVGIPLLVRPNAGRPEVRDGETTWPETPEEFASGAPALIEAGARVIGGCCGTTPAHIRALRDAIARLAGGGVKGA